MSRLELAADGLQAALERLENAAKQKSQGRDAAVAELEAERERLLARIAVLEDEMAALTSIASEVEDRLDGAIGEFRAAMAR